MSLVPKLMGYNENTLMIRERHMKHANTHKQSIHETMCIHNHIVSILYLINIRTNSSMSCTSTVYKRQGN